MKTYIAKVLDFTDNIYKITKIQHFDSYQYIEFIDTVKENRSFLKGEILIGVNVKVSYSNNKIFISDIAEPNDEIHETRFIESVELNHEEQWRLNLTKEIHFKYLEMIKMFNEKTPNFYKFDDNSLMLISSKIRQTKTFFNNLD